MRTPGASAQAIDRAYFGEHADVPPYEPDPRDESESQTAVLVATMTSVMGADGYPPMEQFIAYARGLRGQRPDFDTMSDAELVAHGLSFAAIIRETWDVYCYVVIGASIGPGAVQAVCEGLGRGDAVSGLFGALGGVESASSSTALWALSRIVRDTPELTAAFDAGTAGVLDRIGDLPADVSAPFFEALAVVTDDFGHRGPHEWDLASPTWSSDPQIALGMVERIRLQDADGNPRVRAAIAAKEREALTAELLQLTEGDATAHDTLAAGLRSGQAFYRLREAGKDAAVRVMNEARQPFRELGRRLAERGDIERAQDIFLVLDTELPVLLADPAPWRARLAERAVTFAELADLDPPQIVSHPAGAPPISTWAHRSRAAGDAALTGTVLTGVAAAPGVASGRARVIHDMAQAVDLEPGDVMVCTTTDPSWVPLFMTSAAVVCNVGALASHAAIVSRELGVPCVVSVVGATTRIPDGAMVTVDGSKGTVTIDADPA